MIDSNELRAKVKKLGLKYNFIANKMGLSRYGLQLKIDNEREFKASEIEALTGILSLSIEERDKIFFSTRVTDSQQVLSVRAPDRKR